MWRFPCPELRNEIALQLRPPGGQGRSESRRQPDKQTLIPQIAEQMRGQSRDPPCGNVSNLACGGNDTLNNADSGFEQNGVSCNEGRIRQSHALIVEGSQSKDCRVLRAKIIGLVKQSLGDAVVRVRLVRVPLNNLFPHRW